jgi:hypothetical protein
MASPGTEQQAAFQSIFAGEADNEEGASSESDAVRTRALVCTCDLVAIRCSPFVIKRMSRGGALPCLRIA